LKIQIALTAILMLMLTGCQPDDEDYRVMTVNGSIFASDMGVTLVHEHVSGRLDRR
jgi:hypothetical protein